MKVRQLSKSQRVELETPTQELYNSLLFEDIKRSNDRLKRIQNNNNRQTNEKESNN